MLNTAKRNQSLQAELPADVAEIAIESGASCRFDPLSGDWTILAPKRAQRPDEFQQIDASNANDATIDCPFCCGAEDTTPSAVWIGKPIETNEIPHLSPASLDIATSLASMQCSDDSNEIANVGAQDWMVRVVPNKYPAISTATTPERSGVRQSKLFREKPVRGGHEVIIESPLHHESLADLDAANFSLVFAAYRDRMRHWHNEGSIQYISLFKNSGGNAGASLAHSHSQLIATDMMPSRIQNSLQRMKQHRAETGCCLQCDLLRAELKDGSRIIAKTDELVAFCPFASRLPMSVRITTLSHQDRFELLSDATIESASFLLKRVAGWLQQLHPGVAYNYLIRTRPPGAEDSVDSFHWSLDIFPRVTRIAGFEFSSDCMINSTMPEDAAAEFRKCASAEDPRRIL